MADINKALSNYLKVTKGIKKPRFKTAELDAKIAQAFRMLEDCTLCERVCI